MPVPFQDIICEYADAGLGSKEDYDGWASLGNKGWDFDSLAPYFRKHQCLDTPNPKDKKFMPTGQVEKNHGSDGPIHTSVRSSTSIFQAALIPDTSSMTITSNSNKSKSVRIVG